MRSFALFSLLALASHAFATDTFEAFAQRIREARASQDPAKIRALYYLKDASPSACGSVDAIIKSKLDEPKEITSITSIPTFAENNLPQLAMGKIFFLPQRPSGYCFIQFAKNASNMTGTYSPYAEIDGTNYLLAGESAPLPSVPEKMASYSININAQPREAFVPSAVVVFKAGSALSWAPVSGSSGFAATELVSICIPPSPTAKTYEVDIRKGSKPLIRQEFDAAQGVLWTGIENPSPKTK